MSLKRLLIVEDDEGVLDTLVMLLGRTPRDGTPERWEVHLCRRVDQAKRMLGEQGFDAVLTDWNLPDGTGGDIIACSTAPVVVYTANLPWHLDEHRREMAAAAGLLEKPANVQALRQALHKAVEGCR